MNENDLAYELSISHQIGIQRYGTGVINKTIDIMQAAEKDIIARLSIVTANQRAELELFLAFLRNRIDIFKAALNGQLEQELSGFAAYEADYQVSKLSTVAGITLNRPSDIVLASVATSKPFQGRLLREWTSDLSDDVFRKVRDAVRIGFVEGESADKIVRRIRGTRSAGYKDGVMEINRRNAAAIVRTAVNHTANAAREETYAATPDIFSGVMWVSVLDSRTTPICQSRDGEVYPLNSGARPPAHIGCRSTTSPVIDGVPMPKRINYEQWLKKQPKQDVREILGKTRADLFLKGGISIDKFVDPAGNKYTLDELKRRDSEAFDRIGKK